MRMKFMTISEICNVGKLIRSEEFDRHTKREMIDFAKELFDMDIPKHLSKTEVKTKILSKYSISSSYLILLDKLHDERIMKIRSMSEDNDELEELSKQYLIEV